MVPGLCCQMHFPSEQVNLPEATWIRGPIQVNNLQLNLQEANVACQGLQYWGRMIDTLSYGQMLNSFAWRVHKCGWPFSTRTRPIFYRYMTRLLPRLTFIEGVSELWCVSHRRRVILHSFISITFKMARNQVLLALWRRARKARMRYDNNRTNKQQMSRQKKSWSWKKLSKLLY